MRPITHKHAVDERLAAPAREARVSEWSADQLQAIETCCVWRDNWTYRAEPLTLGGYAGSGKTELVAHLVNECWQKVAVAALAGKAASVLRSKGVPATTIHGLIYVPTTGDDGKTRYEKRTKLEGVEVIIIDEASMVDNWIHKDLMSFGLPILYVGDHGQLEPIGENPRLMESPKVRLEQIHRQAVGNPILRLATAFREGREADVWAARRGHPPRWQDATGRLQVMSKYDDAVKRHVLSGAQVICGFNKSRHKFNAAVRKENGCDGQTPEAGERIIFLRNSKHLGLFNGQQAIVRKQLSTYGEYTVELQVETDDGELRCVPCLIEQFGQETIKNHRDEKVALADFAYAVTAHKFQGSESDNVVVFEEVATGWDARRWRYTAVTRARKSLVYCA